MNRRNLGNEHALERRNREADAGGDRFVDFAIDFVIDGEILLARGGRWDRRLPRYDRLGNTTRGDFDGRESETSVVVRLHPGQRRAVEWFATWLEAHAARRDNPPAFDFELDAPDFDVDVDPAHVYSALFAGGRRAGKSWIAFALAVCYAVTFPGAIVWLVAPAATEGDLDEIRRYIGGCVAPEWLDDETNDGWELINGSTLMLKGAHAAESLKKGEAHFVVLNEGQRMKQRAYTLARGAIVDKSGLVLVCANPPTEAGDEQWITDFAADAAAGNRASVYLHFNSLLNPHIDRRSLLAMRAEIDERSFAIEVLGEFRSPKDAVAYNWIRLENEREAPPKMVATAHARHTAGVRLGATTSAFISAIEEGEGIDYVVGLDVQRFPYIGGPVFQFFGEPTRELVRAHVCDEAILEGGDEVDFCDLLAAKGYHPSNTLIICDASGSYQHSRRRSLDSPPPEWHGRGSHDIIRSEGWTKIASPSRLMKSNPAIQDRVRAFTSMICSGVGIRRLFADPELAPLTCKAIREWRTKHGTPSRTQQVAHLGDGVSYPIVRLFPRALRSGKPGAVDPVVARVDHVLTPSTKPELRILPPDSGPARPRRGDRLRGY